MKVIEELTQLARLVDKEREPEKGTAISRKSIAAFVVKIIEDPTKYVNENLGISKPNS